MASTIVLYDQLEGAATTGTWSKVSGPGPAAPGTYNGTIDFAMTSNGVSVYRYTVTSGLVTTTADVTVTWNPDLQVRPNDTCTTATVIPGTNSAVFSILYPDSNAQSCELGLLPPTDSGETEPANWIYTPYSGDLWYQFTVPALANAYTVYVSALGSPSTSRYLAMQLFVDAVGTACGSKTEKWAGSTNQYDITGEVQIPANQQSIVRIRIVTKSGYEGDFNISLVSDGVSNDIAVPSPSSGFIQRFNDVSGTGTLVWTQNNGQLPVDLDKDVDVFQNGVRLEFGTNFTVTRNSGVNQSTFQITYPVVGYTYIILTK